ASRLAASARFSAQFCPQGDTRGKEFLSCAAGRNGFPLERVAFATRCPAPGEGGGGGHGALSSGVFSGAPGRIRWNRWARSWAGSPPGRVAPKEGTNKNLRMTK